MYFLKILVEGFLIYPVVEFLLFEPGEVNFGPVILSFIEGSGRSTLYRTIY
jgi:hypothetical protein